MRLLGHPQAPNSTQRIALPADASCMSFAHLLSLLLDARHMVVAGSNLQSDYVRYLGRGSTILCLHYSRITPYVVRLPAAVVHMAWASQAAWLQREIRGLMEVGLMPAFMAPLHHCSLPLT